MVGAWEVKRRSRGGFRSDLSVTVREGSEPGIEDGAPDEGVCGGRNGLGWRGRMDCSREARVS